jgi:hypothetical protein
MDGYVVLTKGSNIGKVSIAHSANNGVLQKGKTYIYMYYHAAGEVAARPLSDLSFTELPS